MRVGQANSYLPMSQGFAQKGALASKGGIQGRPAGVGGLQQLSPQEIQILAKVLLQFIQALMSQMNSQGSGNGFPRQVGQQQNFGASPPAGAWPQAAQANAAPQAAWTNHKGANNLAQNNTMLPAARAGQSRASAGYIPFAQPHSRGLREAGEDMGRIQNLSPMIERIANQYDIPPSILAGIVSRETRGRNVIGDNGHGHGLAQVDSGSFGQWTRQWRASGMPAEEGLRKGAEIFANKRTYLRNRFPNLTPDQLMTATLSAYNGGEGAVGRALQRGASTDSVTTGKDYARDVLNRASIFANQIPNWMPRN